MPELVNGDIVMKDKLNSHKGVSMPATIQTAGAKLVYLPPHRPNPVPIENAFSPKAKLRKASERALKEVYGPPSAHSFRDSRRSHMPTSSKRPSVNPIDEKIL